MFDGNKFSSKGIDERNIMKIVIILGARPQFIKAAAVSREVHSPFE